MEKKVIEVKDKATALEMKDKHALDNERIIINMSWEGYRLVLQKFDKKIDPLKLIPEDSDVNLIEETEYIVKADILNITADKLAIQVEAEFKDDDSFLLYQQYSVINPEFVLGDIIYFEEYSCCFESVEIEPGLKTYLEELLDRTDDE